MAKELAEKAKEAFLDDDFDVAADLYSKAIDLDPSCASFFADRAQANIKLLNFTGNNLFLTPKSSCLYVIRSVHSGTKFDSFSFRVSV